MATFIALSGFMGCGKSSVAGILAEKMQCFFFDLDDTIEMEEDKSVSGIFAEEGEEAFRKMEAECLERIFSDYEEFPATVVLSLGGGTALNPLCRPLLKKYAECIYLRCGVKDIVDNLLITGISHRPLLQDCTGEDGGIDIPALERRVTALLEQRSPLYEAAADKIIDIDGLSPTQIAERLSDLA